MLAAVIDATDHIKIERGNGNHNWLVSVYIDAEDKGMSWPLGIGNETNLSHALMAACVQAASKLKGAG